MEKISHWTWLGYLTAAVYAAITIYQYWLTYPDTSQFLMNMAIAVMAAAISWLYNENKQREYSIDAVEEYLADKKAIEDNKGVETK